jgi:hypothetical protein
MAITGYSPLFGTLTLQVDRNPLEKMVSRAFRRMNKRRGLMLALNGAATGGTATVTEKRVAHSTTNLGGVRTIETNTYVNRATAAADETAGDEVLTLNTRIATPTNGAGTWPNL